MAFSPAIHGDTNAIPRTSDRIIFARGEALWSVASDGSDERKLASLGRSVNGISRIKVAASGSAMLVSIDGFHAWAELSPDAGPTSLHYLPCGGGLSTSPDLSEDGGSVLCATQAGERVAIYRMRPALDVAIIDREANGPLFFADANTGAIGFGEQRNLVALDGGEPLSPHRPDRSMAVTPDGKRAIGAYGEGEIDVVYTFRLDGRATKRTLMQAARVVSISANSAWASLQQEVDACAVRVSGGQYMCWRRHEALDISSHARNLLLTREGETEGYELLLGSISGTKARKPVTLVKSAHRAAAFWPMKESAVEDVGQSDGHDDGETTSEDDVDEADGPEEAEATPEAQQ